MKFQKPVTVILTALLVLSAAACQEESAAQPDSAHSPEHLMAELQPQSVSALFSERDLSAFPDTGAAEILLSDGGCTSDSGAVRIDGAVITICEGGDYRVSGTLSEGMLVVDCDKSADVRILLDGASVTSSASAALYVAQAGNVSVYTAEQTENTLASSYDFSLDTESNVDAALFSRDDLTLSGTGKITVVSAYGHGIVSKDDLSVVSGSYEIMSAAHGIAGKDSISIADGTFVIDSGKDGIHTENKDDTALGALSVLGGSYRITSAGDALSAQTVLQIDAGEFDLCSGGGAEYGEEHTDEMFGGGRRGMMWGGDAADPSTGTSETQTIDSSKGIKAGEALRITGGTITVDAADDALHSNGDVVIGGGILTMSSGDDGIHADNALTIFDGTLVIPACYEGLEGTTITVSGGETTLTASDDGINAAGGADGSGFFGFGGGMDIFASDGVSSVTVSGGVLRIDAGGDGIDSNGDLHISGGSIYVDGPTDGANGALDYAGDAVITGGTLLAIGSSQMAENVSASSTQGTAMVTLAQSQGASSAIVLTDTDGKTLLEHTAKKSYNCVIVSTPGLLVGGTYTLATGDLETEIVMESTVYGSGGFGGMMPGKQQDGFGGRGNRGDTGGMNPGEVPDFNEIPGIETDENGNAVIPEMPEGGFGDFGGGQMPGGAFPGGEMPSGDIPEGMTPPDMGGMPQGGFGGGIPPEMPT